LSCFYASESVALAAVICLSVPARACRSLANGSRQWLPKGLSWHHGGTTRMGQRRHLLRPRRTVHRPGQAPALPRPLARGHQPRVRPRRQAHPPESVRPEQGRRRRPARQLHRDLDAGARPAPANHTVRQAAEDWLAHGLPGRSAKTIRKNKDVLEPILAAVGTRRLTELTSADIDAALAHMAASYSTAGVAMGHLALKRVIRRAQARRYVTIDAAEFAETPKGQPGRPSRSLTLDQAAALLRASDGTRIGAYIALSLGTGIRTEEARALLWEHVESGDPSATSPRPASIAVWRSVRAHGDTKTPASRRTLGLPAFAADALRQLQDREGRTSGPVFATRDGRELDAANVRREFTAAIKAAGIEGTWSPRELRHTFVSLMSDTGVPVEEIARLAGHASSRTTEIVYRHQLRPVMEKGAQAMDQIFRRTA
jgi:integrase